MYKDKVILLDNKPKKFSFQNMAIQTTRLETCDIKHIINNQVNQIKSTIQRIQTDTPSVILRKRPRFPIEQKSCDYTKKVDSDTNT